MLTRIRALPRQGGILVTYHGGIGVAFAMYDGINRVDDEIKCQHRVHQLFVVNRKLGIVTAVVNGVAMKHVVDISSIYW